MPIASKLLVRLGIITMSNTTITLTEIAKSALKALCFDKSGRTCLSRFKKRIISSSFKKAFTGVLQVGLATWGQSADYKNPVGKNTMFVPIVLSFDDRLFGAEVPRPTRRLCPQQTFQFT